VGTYFWKVPAVLGEKTLGLGAAGRFEQFETADSVWQC